MLGLSNFTWSWKISGVTTTITCKISLQILLSLQHKSLFWSISHSHAKLHHMVFKLLFGTSFIFFFDSILTSSNWLQIPIQLHYFFLKLLASLLLLLLQFIGLLFFVFYDISEALYFKVFYFHPLPL